MNNIPAALTILETRIETSESVMMLLLGVSLYHHMKRKRRNTCHRSLVRWSILLTCLIWNVRGRCVAFHVTPQQQHHQPWKQSRERRSAIDRISILSSSRSQPQLQQYRRRNDIRWCSVNIDSGSSYLEESPNDTDETTDITSPDNLITTTQPQEKDLQQSQNNLLEELDDQFDYDGRISRGNVNENRCGYVCIIGAPNMGKSTLLNALLQEDLCICTSRPQTTRHAILGILSTNNTQICFIDTPGIIDTPAYKLQEGMMEAVTTAFRDSDVLLVVTDLFSTPIPNDTLFTRVQKSTKPVIVVINKIDLKAQAANVRQPYPKITPEMDGGDSTTDTETTTKKTVSVEEAVLLWRNLVPNALLIVPTSAETGPDDPGVVLLRRLLCGGPNVRDAIRNLGRPLVGMFQSSNTSINDPLWNDETIRSFLLPLSPPLYDTDIITDRTERFVASEIIRSVLFTTFQKELPYCCEVRITEFKEPKEVASKAGKKLDNMIRISADIIVERDSQKAIVIGTNGQQIKQVGIAARDKLQDFLQEPVRIPYHSHCVTAI